VALQQQVVDSQSVIDTRIREAITKREEELRVAVMKREEEVAAAMSRREEEIMEAVRKREEEIFEAWRTREEQIRVEVGEAVEERMKWAKGREDELEAERIRLDGFREELEAKVRALDEGVKGMSWDFNARNACSKIDDRTKRQDSSGGSEEPTRTASSDDGYPPPAISIHPRHEISTYLPRS
jgi:hypothetical protein